MCSVGARLLLLAVVLLQCVLVFSFLSPIELDENNAYLFRQLPSSYDEDDEALTNSDAVNRVLVRALVRFGQDVNDDEEDNLQQDLGPIGKRNPVRLGKRGVMRLGKRSPVRLG